MSEQSRDGRALKIAAALAALVATYALVGFLAVPVWLKARLTAELERRWDGRAELADVSFNPFSFGILLEELTLAPRAGESIVSIGELYVNPGLFAYLGGELHVQQLSATRIRLSVPREGKGALTLLEGLRENPDSPQANDESGDPENSANGRSPRSFEVAEAILRGAELFIPDDLSEPFAGEPVASLDGISLEALFVDAADQVVSLAVLSLSAPDLRLVRESGGSLNVAPVFRRVEAEKAANGSAPGKTWRFRAGDLRIKDASLSWEERSYPAPASLIITNLNADAQHYDSGSDEPVPLSMSVTVNDGKVNLEGTLNSSPLTATGDLIATNINLVPLSGYLSRATRAQLSTATAGATGRLRLAVPRPEASWVNFEGTAVLDSLLLIDPLDGRGFLAWETLAVNGVEASYEPLVLRVREARLAEPAATLRIGPEGQSNLARLMKPQAPEPPARPTSERESVSTMAIDLFALERGSASVRDTSIEPPFLLQLESASGRLENLSTAPASEGRLSMEATLAGYAPLEMQGTITPLHAHPAFDITMAVKGLGLPLFSAYVKRYIGYEVKKGTATLDVNYKLKRKKIDGQNTLVLDEFVLGDRAEGTPTIQAPIKLALALLRGADERITLDFSVSGRIDNPRFSMGAMVTQAIAGTLTNIAAAPFAIFARGTTYSRDELGFVAFAPAGSELSPKARKKVDALATAIGDRDLLELIVHGGVAPEIDRSALKERRLARALRVEALQAASSEQVRALYEERVGPVGSVRVELAGAGEELSEERLRAELLERLLGTESVTEDDLLTLANTRAQAVIRRLIEQHGISETRLLAGDPRLDAPVAEGRVRTELEVAAR